MFSKILSSCVIITLTSSLCLAQGIETVSGPGESLPVPVTTEVLAPVLNSAPAAPEEVLSVDDITITPAVDTAVVTFSTNIPTYAVIDYGLTMEYEHSLMTEEQTLYSETLGELLACKQYFYRISVGDTSNEGSFRTTGCPTTKKIVSKPQVIKKTATPTPAPVVPVEMNNDEGIMNNEEELVLNAAPEMEIQPIEQQNEGAVASPEAPDSPILTDADDTLSADQMTGVPTMTWLILFALLSGMIVLFAAKKKHKKWFQK